MPRLYRRGNIFYFRATVPHKWRTAVKALEIKFSLQTDNRLLAKIRCRFLSNSFDIFFREENLAKITIAQIHEVAREYFQDELNKALELVTDVIDDPLINIDEEISGLHKSRKKLQQTLTTGKYDELCTHDAELIWKELAQEKTDLEMRDYLRRTITKAMILRKNYLLSELTGTTYDGYTNDPIFNGIMPTHIPLHPMSEKEEEADKNEQPSLLLSDAIQDYLKLKKPIWVKKTIGDNLRSLNLLTSVAGCGKNITDINKDDIIKVRNTLMNIPAGVLLAEKPLDKKYIDPIGKTGTFEKLSYTTQDKYFTMIRTFLKWAVDEERIPVMPGSSIKIMKNHKTDAGGERDPYSIPQLEKIFTSPLYTGSKSPSRRTEIGNYTKQDAYYWIPIVALYSGMRLGEIVQLSINDIKLEYDVWFFDISRDDDDDKIIKTSSSIRKVPIHHQLIKLGLIEYYQQNRAAKKTRLFYEIKRSASGGYSDNFSKWWARYMESTKIRTPNTTFHSFRHTFIDALREGNVNEGISRSLTGHSSKRTGDVHSQYGKGASIKRLKTEIDKVDYPFLETHWSTIKDAL